jgi:ATP-dependent RNA helicase DeaD
LDNALSDNRTPKVDGNEDLTSATTDQKARFEDLSLSPTMLAALKAADYLEPTPIQAGLIPLALEGIDVVGQARTGTGKTAAFAIPILERIRPRRESKGPQALILVPTRELAVQVRGEVAKLAHGSKVQCVAVYGGKPLRDQVEKLRKSPQVVVGTPGRLLDHMSRRTLDLADVWCVVLDEADRMLDIGFRPDIERILRRCPRDRQTMLLSATVPPPIQRLAERYMREPRNLNFSPKDLSVDTIDQYYFTVPHERKFDLLLKLLNREDPRQAIIFCRTKRGTERIYQRLSKRLQGVSCMHGDMQQSARDRVMSNFREGKVKLLVATDVVGRGIDVTGISHIVNYDIPQFCDDYIHRVGRTGRMGREGVAFTFVAPEEGIELTRIEQRINLLLKRDEMDGSATWAPDVPTVGQAALGDDNGDSALSQSGQGEQSPSQPEPPPPPFAKRHQRRHRRAL